MIVTLCGSARFEDHFKTWNEALTMAGHTVFTLTRYPSEKGRKEWYSEAEKKALDEAHKRKINASEAVLVLNVMAYMGPSTLSEIEHAKARGKKLYALESWGKGNGIGAMHFDHVQEARRRIIPEGYIGSPIDTTSSAGFRYAYDLFDGLSYDERGPIVGMVGLCDERLRTHGVQACPGLDKCATRHPPLGDGRACSPKCYEPHGVSACEPLKQPAAWRREWAGDESDASHWLYTEDEAETKDGNAWQPLFLQPPTEAEIRSSLELFKRIRDEGAAGVQGTSKDQQEQPR